MKKIYSIIVLFAIVFVIAAGSVSAEVDLFYPGAQTTTAPVNAGIDVDYEYFIDDTYSVGDPVHGVIELLDSGFTPITTLVDVNSNGFYYAAETVDTTALAVGSYYIFGTATDAYGSYTDYLQFDVIGPANNAPYFQGMNLAYSYPLNMVNVDVVDLSLFGFDLDADPLTYTLSASTTPSVATCSLIGTTVNCDLWAIGFTTVDVTVTDGIDSTTETISIQVTPAVNAAPVFDPLFPLFYSFPEVPSNADVVDLALYVTDPENDPLTYWADTSASNPAVIAGCSVVGSVLNCNWAGVGTTNMDVLAFDGTSITTQTITIEVTPVGNDAPIFVNMTQFYMYHVSTGSASVVDLAAFGFDANGDPLTYTATSSSDPTIANTTLVGTVLESTFPGNLGIINLDVTVSDGTDSTTVTIYINVYDFIGNNTAPFFMNMAHFYMYDINAAPSAIIDINHGFDAEGDPLSYYLDTGFTNPSILSCALAGTDVDCDFNGGLGITTFDAIVSDGVLSSVDTIYVLIYDSNAINNAPYFDNMASFYSYPLLLANTDVVDLDNHGADLDLDPLTYFLDTGFTSPYVLDASLVSGNMVHADLLGLGTTTVRAIVYDGQWASEQTLTIEVTNSTIIGPVAVIDTPLQICPGVEFVVDGTGSYTVSGANITGYTWVITDNQGNPLVSSTGAVSFYTITTPGDYFVSLQVVDSNGDSAFAIVPIEVLTSCGNNIGLGTEEGLKIRSFTVDGFDFEKAYAGGDLVIWAEVENVADVDFEGIRMIYTLPEFGIRFKSGAFNLESGERDVVQILGFVPDYVEEGFYYPYIEFSDNEFRRVKVGYLEVYEQ